MKYLDKKIVSIMGSHEHYLTTTGGDDEASLLFCSSGNKAMILDPWSFLNCSCLFSYSLLNFSCFTLRHRDRMARKRKNTKMTAPPATAANKAKSSPTSCLQTTFVNMSFSHSNRGTVRLIISPQHGPGSQSLSANKE